MSEHPTVSKQLVKRFKGLFKRASRRGGAVRRRKSNSAVMFQAAQTQASAPQSPRLDAADQADQNNTSSNTSKKSKDNTSKKYAADGTGTKTRAKVAASKADGKTAPKAGGFWSDLFLVRPWLLVGGLWLTFVLMIAIALAGLSNPGREMTLNPVSSSIAGQPLSAPDVAAASRLPARDGIALAQRDPAATLPPDTAGRTAWALLVLVVVCAGGCMLMSQTSLLTNEARRGRRRAVVGESPRPRPVRASGGRQRRSRRISSHRPAAQVMAFRTGGKIRHTPLQQTPTVSKTRWSKPRSKPVSFAVTNQSATQVTVVPEGETSPLDWQDGSLAHKLDVRQTRSINSFL